MTTAVDITGVVLHWAAEALCLCFLFCIAWFIAWDRWQAVKKWRAGRADVRLVAALAAALAAPSAPEVTYQKRGAA